ncbi:hypothetical protein NQZ68_033686 [Dissostichus eleginoides]|nr:hypothetical protein NQZ68_033686 [Dissostichus eleginoides]
MGWQCKICKSLSATRGNLLKEPGSFSGYYGWQQSIKYKMANYRTKLRGYGVPEAPSNPSIDMSRDLVIRCLMVCLGESTDHLLKEYDDPEEDNVSQDLAAVRMTIYRAKNNAPEDIDIVVEGIKVLTALGTFPMACSLLIGLAYALNLAYPKEIQQTLEVFQKLFLELDCSKLSPKQIAELFLKRAMLLQLTCTGGGSKHGKHGSGAGLCTNKQEAAS